MEWFEELKRRGVYKATAVYTVVAWSLLQAIDIIAPAFNAPQWLNQTLILVLLAGFPVVLILSWMFDFSFSGLRILAAQYLIRVLPSKFSRARRSKLDYSPPHRRKANYLALRRRGVQGMAYGLLGRDTRGPGLLNFGSQSQHDLIAYQRLQVFDSV